MEFRKHIRILKKPGKRFIFNMHLKTQLVSMLMIVSVIPLVLVGSVVYTNTINNVNVEKQNTLRAYSEGILNSVETKLESTDSLLKGLASQSDIAVVMENFNRKSPLVDTPRYSSIQFSLKNVIEGSEKAYETVFITDIHSNIVIDGYKHQKIYKNSSFYDMKDFETIKSKGELLVGDPIISKATGKAILPVSRPIKSLSGFLGVITIMFDINSFTESFSQVKPGNTGEVLAINSDGIIISHPDLKLVNTQIKNPTIKRILSDPIKDGEFLIYTNDKLKKALYYERSKAVDWLICAQVDNSEYFKAANALGIFMLVITAILLALIIPVSFAYSGYITKPINKLIDLMKQVEKGELRITADFRTNLSEINEMKKGFTDMVTNLKNLINDIINASKQINDTTLNMAEASENSIGHARQTTSEVADIVSGIQKQAENTDVVTKNIEHMAEKIFTAGQLSTEMSSYVEKVNISAEKGLEFVDILKEKSRGNIENTELVSSVIKLLNNELQEINIIAATITKISKQTKLLSLICRWHIYDCHFSLILHTI